MREVAERAGVSIATVSFVLNGTKPVSPATRARIEAAMAELGYRRNVVARALARRRTNILAMVYPALDHRIGSAAAEFFTSAADAARTLDYHLVLWPVGSDGADLRELVGQGLADGVVLTEVQLHDPRLAILQETSTPFTLIGRTAEPGGLSYVDIDFDATVDLALQHLHDQGHRDIALISGDPRFEDYGPYVRTEAAYLRLAKDPLVVPSANTPASGKAAASRLPDHITAVLVLNEYAALGAASTRTVLPLLMTPETAALSTTPLTYLRTPAAELGRLATQALIQQLQGAPTPTPHLLPATLQERP
ncbi:LacI family DNA-binding transcriptional regulator [Kribbella sandramycini]|nr:LacI family DNA-binding transcriptional regulator [Kribbella sandramycini]